MPRPYGWIRGEGTYKNQRWGLGSFMDTPVIPQLGRGFGDLTAPCPGSPGCPGYVTPNSMDYLVSLQDELASLYDDSRALYQENINPTTYAAPTVTVGDFLKEHGLVIGVGVLALMLLTRR